MLSIRHLSLVVVAHRASVLKCRSFRFSSGRSTGVFVQKLALSRLQQSVPLSAFQVPSRSFSLSTELPPSESLVWDANSKLVLMDGRPFTGHSQVTMNNHSIYSGDFVDGKRHGHGVLKYTDGDVYEGKWKDNHKDGVGITTNTEGKIISQGLFREGSLFTGTGILTLKSGSKYEGEVSEGQSHGQGKYTGKTGEVWEGEFREGKPFNGHGQIPCGPGQYFGALVEGKRHGHGVVTYKNGNRYDGEFKHDSFDGNGVLTNTEGKIISQGLFREGSLFTGSGRVITSTRSIYEGEMLEGERHGQGKFTSKTGKVWEGDFKYGEPFNGKGWFHSKQGVWVEGVFTADKPVAHNKKHQTPQSKRSRDVQKVGTQVDPEFHLPEESEWGLKY